jgi:hypothetical protein
MSLDKTKDRLSFKASSKETTHIWSANEAPTETDALLQILFLQVL